MYEVYKLFLAFFLLAMISGAFGCKLYIDYLVYKNDNVCPSMQQKSTNKDDVT